MTKKPKSTGWEKANTGRRKREVRKGKRSAPAGKRRLLVSKQTHDAILEIIQGWPLDRILSWDPLMEVINHQYGGDWARQTISNHDDLQDAFTKRQEKIRAFRRDKAKQAGRRVSRTRDEEVAYLKKQIELLNRENVDLKRRLEEQEDRMNRWRRNAFLHRMTPHQLDAPMQENDRDR
jgi:hypothetical protein